MTGSAAFVSAGGAIGVGSVVVVVVVVVLVVVVVVVVVVVLVVVVGATVVVDAVGTTSLLLCEHAPASRAEPMQRAPMLSAKRRDISISLPALRVTRRLIGHHRRYRRVCRCHGMTIRQVEGRQGVTVQPGQFDRHGGVGIE